MDAKHREPGDTSMDTEYTTEILAHPGEQFGGVPDRDEYDLDEYVKVACPGCESEGRTYRKMNLCGTCGTWFEVVPDGE